MGVNRISETYRPIEQPNSPITWMLGNVGTWQRLTIQFEASAYIEFAQDNPLFMEEPNRFTLTNGSDWNEEGFQVGDTFTVVWEELEISTGTTTLYSVFGSVVDIQGNVMLSSNTTLGAGAQRSNIYPVQLADFKFYNVFVTANMQAQSMNFDYAHILNSQFETAPLASLIDGTTTSFLVEGVDSMNIGDTLSFEAIAPQSGMSIANVLLSYRNINNVNPLASGFFKRTYDIDVFFMPSVFFDDNSTPPSLSAPDAFAATECLTDNYQITLSPVQNNPNVTVSSNPKLSAKLGNTGWFDENYNGLADDFVITSLEYRTPSGAITDQLDYQNNTLFRATVEGVQNISGLSRCMFGFQWLPNEQEQYKNNEFSYYKNSKTNTGGAIGIFGDVFPVTNTIDSTLRQGYSNDNASMDVKNVRFSQTGANEITFECEFQPSTAFASFMDALDVSERNYIIWISVADGAKPPNTSNRVSKLLDSNQLEGYIEPIGAFGGLSIELLNHFQDENSAESQCGNSFKVEDGLLARILFALPNDDPLPTGVQFGVALKNEQDGSLFELEATPVDLSTYPNVSNYNYSATRGFKLPSGNNKNFVKLEAYPALDTATSKGVRGLYGFKLRWEDWLSLGVVPVEVRNAFFDNTLNSDGLSFDWYRYLDTIGWSLQFYFYISTNVGNRAVRYINTRELAFEDYDQNANITTSIAYSRESNGAPVTAGIDPISGLPLGVILENERTKVEITYTRASGTWSTINDTFAITTIEVRNGIGAPEYRELSTEYPPEFGNPLESDTGVLELTLLSPTEMRATCFVNAEKLQEANEYKITGRIGCK